MNPVKSSFDPADEAASLWAARLDGGALGDGERAELEAWLAGDPGRRALLDAYLGVSAALGRALPALAAAGMVQTPARPASAARRWAPGRLAAAGVALGAVAAAAIWLSGPGGRPETIAAPVAQRRVFTLADGTKVELSANTSLVVEGGRAERRVQLADGEAFFEVTKDKTRPFVVETPAGTVRVTGTRFDVRTKDASELVVTVVEGSVQVRSALEDSPRAAEAVVLGPGDRLEAGKGGLSLRALSADALADELAWREGQIVCRGMPLSDLLATVGRYHGRTIIATPGASQLRIGGRASLDDLDQFFKDLEVLQPKVRVVIEPDGTARVGLRTEE